jgi:hypothetical protein
MIKPFNAKTASVQLRKSSTATASIWVGTGSQVLSGGLIVNYARDGSGVKNEVPANGEL